MTWERQRSYDLAAGYEKGVRECAKNLLRMGVLTPEQIAEAVSLPLEEVLALREELSVKEF